VLIEPADLEPNAIVDHVEAHWGRGVLQAEYAPLGFGSHHWWLRGVDNQRWFATVDDLRMGERNRGPSRIAWNGLRKHLERVIASTGHDGLAD